MTTLVKDSLSSLITLVTTMTMTDVVVDDNNGVDDVDNVVVVDVDQNDNDVVVVVDVDDNGDVEEDGDNDEVT